MIKITLLIFLPIMMQNIAYVFQSTIRKNDAPSKFTRKIIKALEPQAIFKDRSRPSGLRELVRYNAGRTRR